MQDCACDCSNHENVPLRFPAAGKINTHSYENVPFRSPAAGKINNRYPNYYAQDRHHVHHKAFSWVAQSRWVRTAAVLMKLATVRADTCERQVWLCTQNCRADEDSAHTVPLPCLSPTQRSGLHRGVLPFATCPDFLCFSPTASPPKSPAQRLSLWPLHPGSLNKCNSCYCSCKKRETV